MRKLNAATETAAQQPPRFDVSTWSDQAKRLARNEAEAAALRLLLGLIVIALLAGVAVVLLDVRLRLDAGLAAAAVGGLALLVALRWLQCYSGALGRNTHEVRRATWQEELRPGRDIDGDGHVGKPAPVGHVVKINGPKPAQVTLPDLDPPRAAAPLVHFPICPNDVVYVLTRAAREGLGYREWQGHRLPSGGEIERDDWAAILDGLITWQMASASTDAAGRRRTTLRSDVPVETMVQAVRTSVEP